LGEEGGRAEPRPAFQLRWEATNLFKPNLSSLRHLNSFLVHKILTQPSLKFEVDRDGIQAAHHKVEGSFHETKARRQDR
jgi:hypothetical protein